MLKLPDELVFGRILPATGMMLCLSTVYYAWLAYRLAKQTGRDDVSQSVMTYTLTPPITQADMTRDPLTTASSFSLRSLRRGDPNRHSSGAEPIRSATSRATRDA